jgi:hypothetical protein
MCMVSDKYQYRLSNTSAIPVHFLISN